MSRKPIPSLIWEHGTQLQKRGGAPIDPYDAPPLWEFLWRRRWTIALTTAACLLITVVFLVLATRVYRAQARLEVEQNGPHVFSDNHTDAPTSETFLYTQAQQLQSVPVLRYALDEADFRHLKTFAKVSGDPVDWLQGGNDLKVEVGKKDDIITVSFDSPYPQDAVAVVKGIVDGYLYRLSHHKRLTGEEMVRILTTERAQLEQRREAGIDALVRFKAVNGAVSFRDEKGNITVERLASLSTALTAAELSTLEVRVQHDAAKSILADPEAISAYVEAQQMKGRDFGDREFDDLRSQLEQYTLTLRTDLQVLGPNHVRSRAMQSAISMLQEKIADKQRSIADARLVELTVQLNAAENREKVIRASLETQRQAALALNPRAAEYARLENDVDRMQKQCDVLDSRIQEVSVNNLSAGALNVEVFDPAHADESPVRPRKWLCLGVALLAGLLLGTGFVMAQEWHDKRLRTPHDIAGGLGIPLLGSVPRMQHFLSISDRGQIVHFDSTAEAAESYRAVRTTIHFSPSRDARTILLTSPTTGEGKSTCASNLAIAYAQAGHRTLLIDCDLRRPVQHRIFRVDGAVGISDVMTGHAKLREAIRPTSVEGLYLLPCGTIPGKPAEMLESKRFAQAMQGLAGAFDRVVIDSPPVLPVIDARILSASADATLLVVRMNRSTRKLSAEAVHELHKVGAGILGGIANDVASADGYYASARRRSAPRRLLEIAGAQHGLPERNAGRGKSHDLADDRARWPAPIMEISEPDSPADARWNQPAGR